MAPPVHEAVLPEPEVSLDVALDPHPVSEELPPGLTDLTDGRLKGRRAFPEDAEATPPAREASPGGWKPPASSMQIVPHGEKGQFQLNEKTDPLGRSEDHRKTHIIAPGESLTGGSRLPPPPAPAPTLREQEFPEHAPGGRSGARLKMPTDADIAQQVRAVVEDWCEKHFRTIAREVISAELRRLAEEKARHLVDP